MRLNASRIGASIAFLAASIALVACGEGGTAPSVGPSVTPTPLPSPTPVGLEIPAANTIYLGIYENNNLYSSNIITVEKKIGRKFALDMHYYGWSNLFPATQDQADLASGRMPVDSWNCEYSDASVVAGTEDALITTRALAVKAFGHPVFLRYLWDMNLPASALDRTGCLDPATDNTATSTFSALEYISAWDRIRLIFAEQGVTNAIWVWSVSAAGTDPSVYYPGPSEVDWIGLDAYDGSDIGFSALLSPSYGNLTAYGKPILISESGEAQASQPTFFQAATTDLPNQFPMIKGFMYYDADTATNDWALNAAGLAALKALGASPYFAAFGSL